MADTIHLYDTTLRDGAQQEGINLSVQDKLAIAAQLDELGVTYIEGGWPGANPTDTGFFEAAAGGADLRTARLAAFGATRRAWWGRTRSWAVGGSAFRGRCPRRGCARTVHRVRHRW